MNTAGITFDGTAPMMEGTWFNPKTGDVIKIRDTFFENNNYIARTTDGRMLNYSQLQNYVRDDSKTPNTNKQEVKPVQQAAAAPVQNTPSVDPDSMLSQEDRDILEGLSNPDAAQNRSAVQEVQNGIAERLNGIADYIDKRGQELTISDQIINRAMEDEEEPRLVVQVSWNAPVEKLRFLKENMGITDSDIVRWITRTLDSRDLSSDVRDSVTEWVDNLFGKEPEQSQEKPKGPLKVPKKKVPMKKK
jgi:hypothetical protein